MASENIRWEVYVEREDFERFREDPEIAALLNLARVVNMLNFCHHALLELPKGDSPASSRAMTNGLFLSAGLLYEGLHVAQTMGKYFRGRESYQQGFAKLMGDERMKRFRSSGLERLRNEAAFHFNDASALAMLKKLNLPEYKFATGVGPQSGNIYYNLADEVIHNHLIGDAVPSLRVHRGAHAGALYFARPYHSWERGSNDNANGLLRQYLPKGSSMAGLSQQQCNFIARKLNQRPCKRLGFKTPLECCYES